MHAHRISMTGEHASMKRKEKTWVGLCASICLVCVYVRSARPGVSQAYNYTLVGVKLITEA